MKNILFSALALFTITTAAYTQPQGGFWGGSRSGNAGAVHAAISTANDALNARDYEKTWSVYTEEATMIDPTGRMIVGKPALKKAFADLMKYAEYEEISYFNVLVRFLGPEAAMATWEAETNVKINGEQAGGKFRVSAVLRKANGVWKIEFEVVTPESADTDISMPTLQRYKS